MTKQEKIAYIKQAVDYNTEHNLYKNDPDFIRAYFTYVGGKYNGQRGDVVSEYYLKQLEDYEGDIDDIELISTKRAWDDFFTNGIKEAK